MFIRRLSTSSTLENRKKKVLIKVELPASMPVQTVSIGGFPAKLNADGRTWALSVDLPAKDYAGIKILVETNLLPKVEELKQE